MPLPEKQNWDSLNIKLALESMVEEFCDFFYGVKLRDLPLTEQHRVICAFESGAAAMRRNVKDEVLTNACKRARKRA
jgi:hypothetical protein